MFGLSQTEKDFIRSSCSQDIRSDGRYFSRSAPPLFDPYLDRKPIDFRSVTIESDIFPHCNGSSRVSIRNAIDVICGVKVPFYSYSILIMSHHSLVLYLTWNHQIMSQLQLIYHHHAHQN